MGVDHFVMDGLRSWWMRRSLVRVEPRMRVFVDSLRKNINVTHVAALEGCLRCGQCATVCAWHMTTNRRELHPKFRIQFLAGIYRRFLTFEGRILGRLGLIDTPTAKDLEEHMHLFWKCTLCGRCTLTCPMGISNRHLVRLARAAYTDAGLSFDNPTLKAIFEDTRDKRHSFGLDVERIFLRVGLFLKHLNVEIPINIPGAEYLFVCPTAGNTKIPDYGVKLPMLLNAAGVSYTVSRRVIDTGTEIDHIVVHHELSKRLLQEWEDEAERLGVQCVLVAECGCDVRTLYAEATFTLGRPFRFPFRSIDSLLLDLIREGRLPIRKVQDKVTLHDPCYVTRLAGLGEMERELLNEVCDDFVEMEPHGEKNLCCNGGAGPLRLKECTDLRREVSRLKAEQISATGANRVVTPCAVCSLSLTDTVNHYRLAPDGQRMVYMMFEMVFDAVSAALAERGESDRVRVPALLENRDPAFREEHSIAGVLATLGRHPGLRGDLEWMEKDEVTERFLGNHPGSRDTFTRLKHQLLEEATWDC